MAQSAAPKHDSTRRATYQDVLDAPKSSTERCTPIRGQRCPMLVQAHRSA